MIFKNYFNSFKFKKEHWISIAIDAGFFGTIVIFFAWFNSYLESQTQVLMQGKTVEQIQALIQSGAPEKAAQYLGQIQSYLVVFVLGAVFLVVGTFLLYSFSRGLLWNYLTSKKLIWKGYWRWNLLHLAFIVPIFIYLFFVLIIKLFTGWLINFIITLPTNFYYNNAAFMDGVSLVLNTLISFTLFLLFIILLFFTYHSYAKNNKVWPSIGDGFKLIKIHKKKLWIVVLLMLVTALVMTTVLFLLRNLLLSQSILSGIIHAIISLLFVAWLRISPDVFKVGIKPPPLIVIFLASQKSAF